MSTSPNYALLDAAREGRNAGLDYCRERARYPLASRPRNPFGSGNPGALHAAEWREWQSAFDAALEAWDAGKGK